jgi:Amidohydrolase family
MARNRLAAKTRISRWRARWLHSVVASLVFTSAAAGAPAPAEPLVIRDVSLLPMTRPLVIEHRTVVIQDGVIKAIGPADELEPPQGARIIEGRGLTLLPGLIDGHVHLAKAEHLPIYVGFGVTTVRDMSGSPEILGWRREIAEGERLGPQIYAASPFIHRSPGAPIQVLTVEQARREAAELAAAGYDAIKVAELDAAPLFALLEEARRVGIPVVGHAPLGYAPNYRLALPRLIAGGMVSLEHAAEVFRIHLQNGGMGIDDFAELFHGSGVALTTLLRSEVTHNEYLERGEDFLSPAAVAAIEIWAGEPEVGRLRGALESIRKGDWPLEHSDVERTLAALRLLVATGGSAVVAGTDSGSPVAPPGLWLHEELALLSAHALSHFDTLLTATVNPATLLDLPDRGTVEVGRVADLLLVEGDPLADLRVLRHPVGVVLHGKWLDSDELAAMRQPVESAFPGPLPW